MSVITTSFVCDQYPKWKTVQRSFSHFITDFLPNPKAGDVTRETIIGRLCTDTQKKLSVSRTVERDVSLTRRENLVSDSLKSVHKAGKVLWT